MSARNHGPEPQGYGKPVQHLPKPNYTVELRDTRTCHELGHVPGCPGRAGGDHEWLTDWVPCPLCGEGLDLNGDDAVGSEVLDIVAHLDCLWDSVS